MIVEPGLSLPVHTTAKVPELLFCVPCVMTWPLLINDQLLLPIAPVQAALSVMLAPLVFFVTVVIVTPDGGTGGSLGTTAATCAEAVLSPLIELEQPAAGQVAVT